MLLCCRPARSCISVSLSLLDSMTFTANLQLGMSTRHGRLRRLRMLWPLLGSFPDDLLNFSKPALAQQLFHVVVFLEASPRERHRALLEIPVLLRTTPPASNSVGNVRTVEDGDVVEATSSAYLCRTESFSTEKVALPWPCSAWSMAARL